MNYETNYIEHLKIMFRETEWLFKRMQTTEA